MTLYLSLLWSFFRIGFLGFGGGYAILPLIFETARGFGITGDVAFSQLVALSQTIPGAVSVNAATYVGYYTGGVPGALITTFGFALPSFILIYIITAFLSKFKESKGLDTTFEGIRPMTIGLIATAVIYVGETSIMKGPLIDMALIEQGLSYFNPIPVAIFVCATFLSGKFKLNPIIIVVLGAAIGAFTIR